MDEEEVPTLSADIINSPFKYQQISASTTEHSVPVLEHDQDCGKELTSVTNTPKSLIHDSNYSDVEESDSGDDSEENPTSKGRQMNNDNDIVLDFNNIEYEQYDENICPLSSPTHFFDHSSLTSQTDEDSVAAASESEQVPVPPALLPAGWQEFQSEEGWTYYYHSESQASTWDRPSSSASIPPANEDNLTSNLSPISLPHLNESHDETSLGRHSLGGNSGSLVTSMNAKGQSALHISAAQNMVEGLSILLQSEISADILDVNGRTSLQLVCMNYPEPRQLQCMKVLIDYGADINFLDKLTGNSLMHFCILTGNTSGLEVLLTAGADSSKTNFAGDTPLHLAAKSAQFECMQKLVLFGSSGGAFSVYPKDAVGESAAQNYYPGNRSSAPHARPHETAWDMYEAAKRDGFTSSLQPPQSYAELAQQRSQRLSRNRGRDMKHNRQNSFDDISVSSRGSGSLNVAANTNGPTSSSKAESAPQPEWVELYTPAGDVYFYNAAEQRVQWENPNAVSDPSDGRRHVDTNPGDLTGGEHSDDYYGNLYENSSQRSGQSTLRERLKQRTPADSTAGGVNSNKSHAAAAAGMNTTLRDTRPSEKTLRQIGGMRTTMTQPAVASEHTPSKSRSDPDLSASPPKPSSMVKVNATLFMTPPSKRGKEREMQTETAPSNKSLTRSISDDTISDLSDQSQSALSTKERHIKVWTRFFENAMNAKSGGKGVSADYDEEMREKSGQLMAAVMQNDFSYVEMLLLGGADANFVDEHLRSPAHYASKTGSVSLLALLYEYSADLELRDGNGQSPLHVASIVGVPDSVTFLLESAVAVDGKDKFGYTPLHLAAISGHLQVCKILVEYGAALDSTNSYGVDVATSVQNLMPKGETVLMVAEYLASVPRTRNGSQKVVPKQSWVDQSVGQNSFQKAETVSGGSNKSKTPWTSLIINTDVAEQIYSSNYSNNSIGNPHDRPYEQPLVGTDGDDYEDDCDYEDSDDKSGIADSVSGAVWGVASTLLGATISMFKKSERGGSKSNSGNYGNNFGSGSALSLAAKTQQHTWDPTAPPTDTELHSRGLGPPPFVADQLQAGVESIRTGATPRRNVSAPVEVKLAVDWYRRTTGSPNVTPKNSDASFDRFPRESSNNPRGANPAVNKPVPLFDYAASAQAKQATGSTVPNQYSLSTIQKKGPSGYPQYVDVFADSSALHK